MTISNLKQIKNKKTMAEEQTKEVAKKASPKKKTQAEIKIEKIEKECVDLKNKLLEAEKTIMKKNAEIKELKSRINTLEDILEREQNKSFWKRVFNK